MSEEEHRSLAMNIKNIHKDLRKLSAKIGPENAWEQHMKDEDTRKLYAKSMKLLAEKHWKKNSSSEDRIHWTVNFVNFYFQPEILDKWLQKDLRTIEKLNEIEGTEIHPDTFLAVEEKTLKFLDVGSSGNFFRKFEKFDIIPIDISPSDESVYCCDFLSVPVGDHLKIELKTIEILPSNHFHVVIFCLLLEYLPSSTQRLKCCEKAYKVLKNQGILIIITPDSSHEMKNSKIIKNWRWTLSKIGFTRIKVEKLMNLTCMAFRKCIAKEVSQSWAEKHSENMKYEMLIPQDKSVEVDEVAGEKCHFDNDLMQELALFS